MGAFLIARSILYQKGNKQRNHIFCSLFPEASWWSGSWISTFDITLDVFDIITEITNFETNNLRMSSAFVCCVKQNMDKLLHRAYHDTRSVKSKKPVSPPLYRQHIYLKMCPEFFSYPPKMPPHRECRLILLIGESIPVVSSRGKTGRFYKRSVHFARETSGLKPVTVECTKNISGTAQLPLK